MCFVEVEYCVLTLYRTNLASHISSPIYSRFKAYPASPILVRVIGLEPTYRDLESLAYPSCSTRLTLSSIYSDFTI